MMQNEKLDNTLNLALGIPDGQLEKDSSLLEGYDPQDEMWRVIVKYIGDIGRIVDLFEGTKVTILLNQYAIVQIKARYLEALAALTEVEYIEKPKALYFNLDVGRSVSCINEIQGNITEPERNQNRLTGRGVLVGIIDSGAGVCQGQWQFM